MWPDGAFLIYQMLFKNPSPISKSCKCSLRAGKGFSTVIDIQSSSRKTEKKKWLQNTSLYFNHEKTPGVKGHCRGAWERTAKHLQAETENILKLLAIQIITQAHLQMTGWAQGRWVKLYSPHLWGVIQDNLTVSPAFILYQFESII